MNLDAVLSLEASALVRTPMAWLETHGAVMQKFPRVLKRQPKANPMQRILGSIIEWCEANGIPARIVGLKARQVGLSTGSMAAAYHSCRRRGTNFMLIGDEYEKSVQNLEDMFWRFAEHDTYDWGNAYHKPSGKFTNGSQFKTDTANDNRSAASGTYQFVVATEVAHWKETKNLSATKVFQAFMSCVPKEPGTVVIVESTANGEGNAYHEIYTGAITFEDLKAGRIPDGWNGFVKVFYAWHSHAEYQSPVTVDEAMTIMATLSDREKELVRLFPAAMTPGRLKWRRQTIAGADFRGNEQKFEEEYPSDEDSAFLSSGNREFSAPHLKIMAARAENSVPEWAVLDWQNAGYGDPYPALQIVQENEAWIKLYERPIFGCRYQVTVDPATGRTTSLDPDNHAILVWREGYRDSIGRWHPKKLAARATDCGAELAERIKSGKQRAVCRWEIDVVEGRVALLSTWFGRCIVVPEINADRGLVPMLRKRGVPIYRQQKYNRAENKFEDYYGFDTTNENRGSIISGLSRIIRQLDTDGDGIEILDPVVVQELRVFVRLANGRTEAMGGWHDDNVLGAAIGVECEQQSTIMREPVVKHDDELSRIERRRRGPKNLTYC